MTKRLTARSVETAKCPAGKDRAVFPDSLIPGFELRVTPGGAKTWNLRFRINGKQRRMGLGRYPVVDLSEAREAAREALRAVDRGQDPSAKADAPETRSYALSRLFDNYERRRRLEGDKVKYLAEKMRLLRKEFADLLERPAAEITRADVRGVLDGALERGAPVMANRLMGYAGSVFNWAVEEELLDASPVVRIRKVDETARDRVLTDAEIKHAWKAFEAQGWPFGRIFQLCLLTLQRRGEVASIEWPQLDLEAGTWRQDDNKSGRPHTVFLSSFAQELIDGLPEIEGSALAFPARGNTDRPVSGWSKVLKEVRKGAGFDGWTIHDLRRTGATGLARLGVAPVVIERILNHAEPAGSALAGVYQRHTYEAEQRAALELWGEHVRALVTSQPAAVVPMERKEGLKLAGARK